MAHFRFCNRHEIQSDHDFQTESGIIESQQRKKNSTRPRWTWEGVGGKVFPCVSYLPDRHLIRPHRSVREVNTEHKVEEFDNNPTRV